MSSQHILQDGLTPEKEPEQTTSSLRFPDPAQRLHDFSDGIVPVDPAEAQHYEFLRENILTPLELTILDLVEAQPAVIAQILPKLQPSGSYDVEAVRTNGLNYAEIESLLLEQGTLNDVLSQEQHKENPGNFVKFEVFKARRKLHLAMEVYRGEASVRDLAEDAS